MLTVITDFQYAKNSASNMTVNELPVSLQFTGSKQITENM